MLLLTKLVVKFCLKYFSFVGYFMSRVGKLPIEIPSDVSVVFDNLFVTVSGKCGVVSKKFFGDVYLEFSNERLLVLPLNSTKSANAMTGTVRSIVNSMVSGVQNKFLCFVELVGVGYRVSITGGNLNLLLGKSHATRIFIPEAIKVVIVSQVSFTAESVDKQLVTQWVAMVKMQRKIEPYKGRGIRIKGEYFEKKVGKKS